MVFISHPSLTPYYEVQKGGRSLKTFERLLQRFFFVCVFFIFYYYLPGTPFLRLERAAVRYGTQPTSHHLKLQPAG
jgi:hypothetical protein